MIFGVWNPENILQENLTDCPPRLSDVATVTWEIEKKVIFNSIIHTYFWLFTLPRKKSIHLPTPPENITTLTCELWNYFIWLKVCCVLSNVGGSEESQLWFVIGGSEKNRLWCVATGMSGKQCHSKCSEWPPSALIHTSSLFCDADQSHSTPRCAEIQPMSQHVHINTRAPPVVCPRRSTKAMQITGSTKQQ